MAAGMHIASVTVVVGHQGGWDETFMVLVPIALFALLLFVANRKARRDAEDADSERGA